MFARCGRAILRATGDSQEVPETLNFGRYRHSFLGNQLPAFGQSCFGSFLERSLWAALLRGRCRFRPVNADLLSRAVSALNDNCLVP